jgi:Zn-dependent protease with chaperone function/Tfp pilus assembly major pilin PilA
MSVASEGLEPSPAETDTLVYRNERSLFILHVLISSVVWLLLFLGTLGIALVYALFFFIGYLFAHSGVIAWIRGNCVRITERQFPDLFRRYVACCRRLGMSEIPEAYVMNGQGHLNAFATRFLGRDFVVLHSNVVDAMMEHPDAINFYIGHELGHVRRKHLVWGPYLWPASILPIIGAAYSRAREYTCDAFGRACCRDPQSAVRGLLALAAGEKRWAVVDLPTYLEQARDTKGFWMSFHELVADYPWIVKRVARVANAERGVPSRHPLAWIPALFVPRFGLGGGLGGPVMMVAIIGILAAIAIPAYQDYLARAKAADAIAMGRSATESVSRYYYEHHAIPPSLKEAGFLGGSQAVSEITIDEKGVIRMTMAFPPVAGKKIVFLPSLDADKHVKWRCASEEIQDKYLPPSCRSH